MSLTKYIKTEKYDPNEQIDSPVDTVINLIAKPETAFGWMLYHAQDYVARYFTEKEYEYQDKFEEMGLDIQLYQETETYEDLSELELKELYETFLSFVDVEDFIEFIAIADTGEGGQSGVSVAYFSYPSVVENGTWLFHFSNEIESIIESGFTLGIDDPLYLGLTTYQHKYYKGYNFAYHYEDVAKYAIGYGNSKRYRFKYGTSFVMFKSPKAVRVWHMSDEEFQVIFWGEDAYDIFGFDVHNEDTEHLSRELQEEIQYLLDVHEDDEQRITEEIDAYLNEESSDGAQTAFKKYIRNKFDITDIISNPDILIEVEYNCSLLSILINDGSTIQNIPYVIDYYVDEDNPKEIIYVGQMLTKLYDQGEFKK
jgi:hypothetical protein